MPVKAGEVARTLGEGLEQQGSYWTVSSVVERGEFAAVFTVDGENGEVFEVTVQE